MSLSAIMLNTLLSLSFKKQSQSKMIYLNLHKCLLGDFFTIHLHLMPKKIGLESLNLNLPFHSEIFWIYLNLLTLISIKIRIFYILKISWQIFGATPSGDAKMLISWMHALNVKSKAGTTNCFEYRKLKIVYGIQISG